MVWAEDPPSRTRHLRANCRTTNVARLEEAHRRMRIGRFIRLWRTAYVVIARWDSRARRRERLAGLDDHVLADIGLAR